MMVTMVITIMVRMVRMFRMIRVVIVLVGNRKAGKEEQGRKCYNDDSGEKHLAMTGGNRAQFSDRRAYFEWLNGPLL